MEKDSSRRKFLSLTGMIALALTGLVPLFASKKIKDEEEYIFINGWLLKKKDLNDL